MIKKITIAIMLFVISLNSRSLASAYLCVSKNDYGDKCINEKNFNNILDTVVNVFQSDFEKAGLKLSAKKEWLNGTENATYDIIERNHYAIVIYGGAGRAKEVSEDALVVIACHELGHLYGLTKSGDPSLWGFEGEADYFAANICMPRVLPFLHDPKTQIDLPNFIIERCSQTSNTEMCNRINKAAFAASRMRARILDQIEPSFFTPDLNKVPYSIPDTNAQCGLDTFHNGSLGWVRPSCWYNPKK